MIGFHWSSYSDTLFIWYGEKQTPNSKYLLELISKEDQKFKRRILTNEKNFPKTISQWEFDYGMFTNLPKIIIAYNFPGVYLNSDEVSYLSWRNKYPNLNANS